MTAVRWKGSRQHAHEMRDAFAAYIRSEIDKWRGVIQRAGIRAE